MIREALESDCLNLTALSIKVWLDTYASEGIRKEHATYVISTFNEDYFLNFINNPDYRLLVSESNNMIQGFLLANLNSHFENEENGFEVEKLYVHENFQRQGIGKSLIQEVKKKLGSNFWLYTWIENKSNQYYEHLGFVRIGLFKFEFAGCTIENYVYKSRSA